MPCSLPPPGSHIRRQLGPSLQAVCPTVTYSKTPLLALQAARREMREADELAKRYWEASRDSFCILLLGWKS